MIRQEADLVAEVPDHLLEMLARFTRNLRDSAGRRPALGRQRPLRDRRRRDHRRRRPAPRDHAGRGRGRWPGSSTSRPPSTCSAARSSSRPARRVARPRSSPTCCAPPSPRPCAQHLAGIDLRAARRGHRGGRDGQHRRAGRCPRLPGRPAACSAGESDLYDQVCDRLGATNDGERAAALELALEGLYLARKDRQGHRGRRDRLWLTRSVERRQSRIRPARSTTSPPSARSARRSCHRPTARSTRRTPSGCSTSGGSPERFEASLAVNAHLVAEHDGRGRRDGDLRPALAVPPRLPARHRRPRGDVEALRPPRAPGPRHRQPPARRGRGDGRGRRAVARGRRRQRPGLRLLRARTASPRSSGSPTASGPTTCG